MKFKKGDNVRIIRNTGNPNFDEVIGEVHKIEEVYPDDSLMPYILKINLSEWGATELRDVGWNNSELELADIKDWSKVIGG